MPMYEYECPHCLKVVEVLQKPNEDAPKCEKCDKPTIKIMSHTSFRLEGSGWYATDYKGSKKS